MKVQRLKELLSKLDDEMEIFIRNSVNPCGNIQELEQIELSTYGCFGENIKCLILNTDSSKEIEKDMEDNCMDFLGNSD